MPFGIVFFYTEIIVLFIERNVVMDIYILPVKKISVKDKKLILIKDIAEVFSKDVPVDKIQNIQVFKIPDKEYGIYKISAIDIIKAITNQFSDANINNLGEQDVLIQYDSKKKKSNKLYNAVKVAAISLVLFFGTATAIMSFHADGEVPKIMKGYYKMFFNEEKENPYIMEIPYSLGLSVGIIIFFNHFGRKMLTLDPTPIEVQMTTYEEEVIKNQLNTASKKGES